ncbi:MAG: hypothetical protein ABTQ32_25580 [Myxococcaceae bacterium]
MNTPVEGLEAQTPTTEDRVGTAERMMEQARVLDAEAAAARAARPAQQPTAEPASSFEPAGRSAANDPRLRGAPTPAARAEEQARARELDRLNQPGNRPITEGLRQRTGALREAQAALAERNSQLREGLGRLGPSASAEVRQRFTDSFRNDPAHQRLVQREADAARDLSQYLRDNADGFGREFPSRADAPAQSEERVMRAHGSNVAFHALSTLARSSQAESAIELAGRYGEAGLLPDQRRVQVQMAAANEAQLNRIAGGQSTDEAQRGIVQQLRGALPPGTLTRDVERTATSFRDLLQGLATGGEHQTPQGLARTGLSVLNTVHDVVKAWEGARDGRALEPTQDSLRAITDGVEALRDTLRLGGRVSTLANNLNAFLESDAGRVLGGAAGGLGLVNNLRDLLETGDWRYGAAAVGEAAQGLAAVYPGAQWARLAGAAGSLASNVFRNGAQEEGAVGRMLPHLTEAFRGQTSDPARAAQVFARNPRALEVMRQAGLSEADIVRRAGDPNARFMLHPSDVDQLRDLLRRERAGR